jgi:hypothetical protein
MLQATGRKRASLLIDDYKRIDDLTARIPVARYRSADPDTPACRFRGSLIDFRDGSGISRLTGWQRNVARVRKMDVSLPTIVTLKLNREGIIEEAGLDPCFKGSKGLMCSWKYLNGNLKKELEGKSFEHGFLAAVKQEKMHCAHLFEVLSGLYTYYLILKENGFKEILPENYAYEEEAIDSVLEGDTVHSLGIHALKGKPVFEYRLSLHNLMSRIGFDRDGTLRTTQGVRAEFSVNGSPVLESTVSVNVPGTPYKDLAKFLLQCIRELKRRLCAGEIARILNTNLHPSAYIGLFTQVAVIRLFHASYAYIMHALTALQRPGHKPACVGAVSDQGEADLYFPGFKLTDLI